MKVLLVGINAKYIHPNLAIRLLKKNTVYNTDIKEFTIKDEAFTIINYIFENNYDTVAFSCYIWNIELIKNILNILKGKGLTIILGGPEVSYNASYYLENRLASYVIKNEGEEAFDLLLKALDKKIEINQVCNLYYENKYTFDKLVDLSKIKMAYDLLDDIENKIVYFETSRGCPFHCAYCMASLDNKVRFFNLEEIKFQIKKLLDRGAKTIKFLDRTFNANKKYFIELIDFLIENHKEGNSFQFEITGDLLSKEIIDYINSKAVKNLFRFEIGIQSTNIKSNLSVDRIQDNEKLFNNIKMIQNANIIDLHLDLIAGLPFEDYKSFEKTFNDVVKLNPKELQLGFLKLLYGTKLKKEAYKYNYKWQATAPYEIISNDYLNEDDIKKIHATEDAFEAYYNSGIMPNSMKLIIENEASPFDFFNQLGKNKILHTRLEDRFKLIDEFCTNKSYYKELHKNLIFDYLSYFKVKPTCWWNNTCLPKDKKEIIRKIYNEDLEFSLVDLYKYSIVVVLENTYIIGIYKQNKKKILVINN